MSTNVDTAPEASTPAARSARESVEAFLGAFEALDYDEVLALSAPSIRWVNAPLTTSSNKQQFAKTLRGMAKVVTRFEVQYHDIHERGDGVVYTDRIDIIEGPGFAMKIPVRGEFKVRDGFVTEWVDRFSWPKLLASIARGIPGFIAARFRGRPD